MFLNACLNWKHKSHTRKNPFKLYFVWILDSYQESFTRHPSVVEYRTPETQKHGLYPLDSIHSISFLAHSLRNYETNANMIMFLNVSECQQTVCDNYVLTSRCTAWLNITRCPQSVFLLVLDSSIIHFSTHLLPEILKLAVSICKTQQQGGAIL
jgi:hypothetical protein